MSDVSVNTDTLVNGHVVFVFQWIMSAGVCQLLGVFGVVTNIINIICFVKQGFKDTVNISLLGLAVSDLGCLLTVIWTNVCCVPALETADVGFDPEEFQYLTSAVPHTTFARISSWLTALITLERCLCITMPLTIKHFVTPKRVSFVIVSVYVVLISSIAHLYVVNKLGWKFFTQKNKTMLGLLYTEDRDEVERIWYGINNMFIPFIAFAIIIICTSMLVIKLQHTAKWRKISTSSNNIDNVLIRNQRVSKMVVILSVLFIACYLPLCIAYIAMAFEPELSISGKYETILLLFAMIAIFLESLNSSVNIFIYYLMSNKYRETFCLIFRNNINKIKLW